MITIVKYSFLTILVMSMCIVGLLLTPFKQTILNQLQMEANAHLNELITSPHSPQLSPLDPIIGAPTIGNITASVHTPFVNLNNAALNQWLTDSQTEVLIIQQRGNIIHESYSDASNRGLAINSMSMAKNVIALLIGIAIDEGHIQSEHSNVLDYLPELNITDDASVSIRDMLNHLSGIQTGFAELEKTLKGEPLTEQLSDITFTEDRQFRYDNINYHLLGIILSRVYQQPLNQVIDNKLWRPLNLEKADIIASTGYCCLFATARSWLAIGELHLNKGMHDGEQIVPKKWIDTMITDYEIPEDFFVQATGVSQGNRYGYHVYGGLKAHPDYYWIEGMGLQTIFINPVSETIIVRLGGIPSLIRLHSNRWNQSLMETPMSIVKEMTF